MPLRRLRVAFVVLILLGGLSALPAAEAATTGPNGLIAFTSD